MIQKRNLGVDLLRSLSMFMVVVLHVLGQGGILTALDAAGLPAGPGETLDTYRARLQERRRLLEQLDQDLEKHQEVTVFESVKVSAADRIPNEIIAEAAEITEPLYGFSVHQFPGFFLSRDVGLLWGGCLTSDTEMPLAIFFIRASFRKKHRFFCPHYFPGLP